MMSSNAQGHGQGQQQGQGAQGQVQGQGQGQAQGPPVFGSSSSSSVASASTGAMSGTSISATQENQDQGQGHDQASASSAAGQQQQQRPLNVTDALSYLEEVKAQFSTQSDVYVRFLDIMKEFKSLDISTTDVISRVSQLFKDHPRLIMGFNTFLPAGFSIELTNDPNLPVRVITPDGLVNYNSQGTIMSSTSNSNSVPSVPASASTSSTSPPSTASVTAPIAPASATATNAPAPIATGVPAVNRPPQITPQPIQPSPAPTVSHALPPVAAVAAGAHSHGHAQSQPLRPLLPSSGHGPTPVRPGAPPMASTRPSDAAGLASPQHSHVQSPAGYLPPGVAPPTAQQQQQQHPPTPASSMAASAPRPFPLPVSQSASSTTTLPHGPPAQGQVAQHHPAAGMTGQLPPPTAQQPANSAALPLAVAAGAAGPATLGNGAVDFGQAITYVNKLKNHFHGQPEVYRQFLEILTNYQKETRPVEEVNARVQDLLKDAPHLIEEFKQFLPLAGPAFGAAQAANRTPFGQIPSTSNAGAPGGARHPPSASSAAGANPASRVQRQTTPSSLPLMGDHFPDGSRGPRAQPGYPQHQQQQQQHPAAVGAPGSMDANGSGSKKRKAEASSRGSASTKKKREGSQGLAVPTGGMPPGPQTLSGRLVAPCDEMELFDKIKKRIGSPVIYAELLKVMNLYSQGALTRDQFVDRVDPFLALRAPDLYAQFRLMLGLIEAPDGSVQPAPTPNANSILHASPHPPLVLRPEIAHMDPALTPIDGTTIMNLKGNQHTESDNPGPSYRRIRKNVPMGTCSGRDAMCRSVLNDEYISHPPQHSDTNPEDNGGTARRNPYEDAFCKTEEDRYEFDMYVEAIQSSIRLLEPIHQLVQSMRDEERAKFTLPKGLGSRHPTVLEKVVKKLYAEGAATVMEALHTSPGAAVGLVLRRLKQKDEEWRRLKREFSKVWREADAKNFYKSLDFQGVAMKESARKFQTKSLLQEIETTYNERKDKRARGTPTAQHHMELRFADKEVVVDVFELLAGLNEASVQFIKLRPFLEAVLFGDLADSSSTGTSGGAATSAGALRRRSSRKHIKPTSSVTCFGNNNIYLVLRLIHSIYTRLESLKSRAAEMARNRHLVRSVNPVAIDLGLADAPAHEQHHKHPLEYYPWTLGMLRSLLTGDMDAARFEEDVRGLYGTWAHHALFLDKMVQNALKVVKDSMTDKQTLELIKLFSPAATSANSASLSSSASSGVNRQHTEMHMRLKAEEVLGDVSNGNDHLFRFVLHFPPPHMPVAGGSAGSPSGNGSGSPALGANAGGISAGALQLVGSGPRSLTVQMLGAQDFINGDEEKWTEYVEQYTTSVSADPMAEQYQQAAAQATAANVAAKVPFLPRAIRKVAQAVQARNRDKPDRVLAHDGLQLKICINTYRLFFIALTEDSFARITAEATAAGGKAAGEDEEEKKKKEARQAKFGEWLNGPQGWNRDATGDVEEVGQRRVAEARKWLEGGAGDKKVGEPSDAMQL